MEAKMVPKWLQHGSKMAPKSTLQKKRARPCCQTLPGAVPERLWHGPGRPQKFILAALEVLGAKSGSIWASWRIPGKVPEGVWEVIWGAFWRLGRRERKKSRKVSNKSVFWSCFCMRFLTAPVCVLFASALAGAKAQLKNMLKTITF